MQRVARIARYALILAVIAITAYLLNSCAEYLDLPQHDFSWM